MKKMLIKALVAIAVLADPQAALAIDNARLWDPSVIASNYQIFQSLQTYYRFPDADTDRYLMVNPYFHMFGLKAGILACIASGATGDTGAG